MEYLTGKLDEVFPFVAALAGGALLVALGLVFFYAPVEQRSMGIVQKIFYSHVPSAMAAYAGFTVTAISSLLYLLKPHRTWDVAAEAGAQIGLIFCAFVLVSGPLWAYKAWGRWWVWDPQLTATLVLFFLYLAYLLLRTFSGQGSRMRKTAAVLAVVAFVDIPIIHWSVKMWRGNHPTVERVGGGGLAPEMKVAFTVSMVAFLLLFVVMLWMSIAVRRQERRAEQLQVDLKDAERIREET
jgi:heme exporter protein C